MIDESKVKFGDVFLFGPEEVPHVFIRWDPASEYNTPQFGRIWVSVRIGPPQCYQQDTVGLNYQSGEAWKEAT